MLKWLRRIAALAVALALLSALLAWWSLRGSLARLDGELALPGLSAPVTVRRDALGVATIDAANEADMARALGYVHAQERFFEMDLMRRSAAGELAELFGPIALDMDKERRAHRMRARVAANLAAFEGGRHGVLQAYADGVNAGLAALSTRPWPYLLLRQQPRKWEVADSALAGYAMYFDLQDSRNQDELALSRLKPHLPPALFALLARDGSEWDAPLQGAPRGNALLPGADQVDLRTLPADDAPPGGRAEPEAPGSNDWAVAGALTADGRAIVADDMHLGLRVPNIWFRARLRYADAAAPGGKVDVSGFSLPGLPAVIVGSNRHVAWGFTNGYIDTSDWLALPKDAAGIREHEERILVAGAPPVRFKVREAEWGPILAEQGGSLLALRWVAHLPGAVNMRFADLVRARDIDEAFAAADHAGIPAQNFVVADASGRIGWRLIGERPRRAGDCDASLVAVSACAAWPIASDGAPAIVDPPSHRLWTANNRTLDGADLARVGNGGYVLGARAKQIRDGLFARGRFAEKDLLALQLDDRALFLQRWWVLLRAEQGKGKALGELATAAAHWDGRAAPESVSYRIVRAWRLAVNERIAAGLVAPARKALGKDFIMPALPQLEGVAWPLLQQRPPNLLAPRYADWDALLEDAAQAVADDLGKQGPLPARRWGEQNTARICHPLGNALPAWLKPALCMPADELAGDGAMPRVAGPAFGASERMVVSPGHEEDGIIHMPGGQSGHPLSPFWGAGHEAWVQGQPTAFLPGAALHVLVLNPRPAH